MYNLLFPYSLNKRQYALRMLVLIALGVVYVFALGFVSITLFPEADEFPQPLWAIVLGGLLAIGTYAIIGVYIPRVRDAGWNVFPAIILLLFCSFPAILIALFYPSKLQQKPLLDGTGVPPIMPNAN